MTTYELLEKYRRWIWNCQACQTCQKGPQNPYPPFGPTWNRICPEYEHFRSITHSAQGRIQAIKALMQGKIDIDDDFVKIAYDCILCGACGPERMGQASCVVDRKQVEMFRDLRTEIVNRGFGPTEPFKKIARAIESEGNRFGAKPDKSKRIPEGVSLPEKADIVYFAGCIASYRNPELAHSTVKVLNKAGVKFMTLGSEWCCGNPLVNSGQINAFENVVKHNVEAIKISGATKVTTSCGCCYNVLKFRYPEIVGDTGFEVVHTSEILAQLIDEGKIKPSKIINGKVTFHDPCHLSRLADPKAPVIEAPRKVLGSIPGIELSEMAGNMTNTQCCGRFSMEVPDVSLKAGENRIKDAQNAGAETIVTGCSYCEWSLSRAARDMGAETRIVDLTQLLAESL